MPGSAGAMGPAKIFKGKRMPGRMGNDRVTIKNLEIVEIDEKNDVLLVKGSIAGASSGLILLRGEGELKIKKEEVKEVKEEVKKDEKSEKKEVEQQEETKKEDKVEIKEKKKEEGKKEEGKKE